MPTMNRYTLLALLAALAGCNAPDTFVLAAIASGDAAPTDVSSDAAGDTPADNAQPDVTLADAGDASEATADAPDAQVGDVASDAAQPNASADVALADASDTPDAAVSDATDASADAGDAPADVDVFAVCERITSIAECTAVRYADGTGCGWCAGIDRCVFGNRITPRGVGCGAAWVW